MTALSPTAGYGLWAPRYTEETATSYLEDRAVRSLPVPRTGGWLLDVGCGTARRLASSDAALAVGVDLTVDMLRCAPARGALAAADVCALPVADASFDRVWCRLVIGHVRALDGAYAELARVCRLGGHVVVTDFHPDAAAAGHRRTFRDGAGLVHEIEHHVHEPMAHGIAARNAGLELVARRDPPVGPPIRAFYSRAGRLDAYESQRGLRLVLALAYRRVA
jgi:malonyl-CoA O-methyltransferase